MIVERPHHKLAALTIRRKGEPSGAATERFLEIVEHVKPTGRDPLVGGGAGGNLS